MSMRFKTSCRTLALAWRHRSCQKYPQDECSLISDANLGRMVSL